MSNDVTVMDAQTKPSKSKEECALGMEQNSNYAAVKDAGGKHYSLAPYRISRCEYDNQQLLMTHYSWP
eukprot:scaffold11515_cov195-Skeletonema_dohrnii-CCMP3373.AAC.2